MPQKDITNCGRRDIRKRKPSLPVDDSPQDYCEHGPELPTPLQKRKDKAGNQEIELNYQALWEQAGNAIVVGDPKGNILNINKKAEALFGYTRQEFLRLHQSQLHPQSELKRHQEAIQRHFQTGLSDTVFNTEIIRKDGVLVPCAITGSRIQYENTILMQAIYIDNTEKHKIETALSVAVEEAKQHENSFAALRENSREALRQSVAHFETLFENAPIPIWVEDFSLGKKRLEELHEKGVVDLLSYIENNPDFVWEFSSLVKIIDVNQTCVDFFEAGNKKDYIQNIRHYFSDRTFEVFRDELLALVEGKMIFSAETPVLVSTGEEKIMLMHMAVVPGFEATLSRVLVAFTDITAQKREEIFQRKLQDEIKQKLDVRTAELEKIYTQLLHAEKMSSLGKLAANIAHEFGSPIFGIRNILLALKDQIPVNKSNKEIFALAVQECNRLEALLTDLQNFNRPTTGDFVKSSISRQIDSMLLLSRKKFTDNNIVVKTDYAADLPEIYVVPDQIKQIVLNLLNNAVEAIPETGGSIQVITEKVDDDFVIHVHDSGCGIRTEDLPFVFEPFFSKKPIGKGTGLGLSVCLGIVQKHEGRIKITSKPGKGTLVSVFLPIDNMSLVDRCMFADRRRLFFGRIDHE